MKIQPIHGDIAEMAPRGTELAALWLRGSGARFQTWRFGIRDRYPALNLLDGEAASERPWLAKVDQVFKVNQRDELLRYIYVFSNPTDAHGLPTLEAVKSAVVHCLDRAVQLEVRSAALIHIPFAPDSAKPTPSQEVESAKAMIDVLQLWDESFPDRIDEVCLVDLEGGFNGLLPPPF